MELEEKQMAVDIETLEGLQRKIILILSRSEIEKEVEKKLRQTQKKVRLDGFRPGKVPLKLVEDRYGQNTRNEVLNSQAHEKFYAYAVQKELAVAGLRKMEMLSSDDNDKESIQVAVLFEVLPEAADLSELSQREVEKAVVQVNDADVDRTLEKIRKQKAHYEVVSRAAKKEDQVSINFIGRLDGQAFKGGSAKDYSLVIGSGSLLEQLENALVGMQAGETKEVDVDFPEKYHAADLAGKKAVFTVTMQEVREAILPIVDEAFAQSLGIKDGRIDKVKEEIRANLQREVEKRLNMINRDAVLNLLLSMGDFALPQVMVDREIARLKQKATSSANASLVKTEVTSDDLFKKQAEKSIKIGLILNQIIDQESLAASDKEVRQVIDNIAQSYEDPQEVVHYYLSHKDEYANARSVATEKNIVNFVLNKVRVKEVKRSIEDLMKI